MDTPVVAIVGRGLFVGWLEGVSAGHGSDGCLHMGFHIFRCNVTVHDTLHNSTEYLLVMP